MYSLSRYDALRVLLVAALMGRMCAAQDWQGGGTGTSPMAPMAPPAQEFQRPIVPGPPIQPETASRPASWPGAVPQSLPSSPPVSFEQLTPCGELKSCGRIIARVGSDAVLESDVIGDVNWFIQSNKSRIPPEQVDAYREMLIQQRLKGLIETKLVYSDAKSSIPSERLPDIEKRLAKDFEENQLEKMMKKYGAATPPELELKLRSLGTSLERERRAYVERSLAQGWVSQAIKRDEEITYDQMMTYYREHQAEFTTRAKAQWEELMVRFSNTKYPSRAAAYEAIAQMGNQVLGGVPLAEVAKANSDGTTAAQGGQCGWNTKGALACAALDDALFNLPVGQLSPIIESQSGYHIIRATDRQDDLVKPFLDAQVDIKKKIQQQRTEKQIRDYMEKIEKRTPVWTVFEGQSGKMELSTREQRTQR